MPSRRTTLSLLAVAGTALAHIAPSPIAIEAGAPATITFNVEHGCAGSNTTGIDIKVPDGITDAAATAKSGWTTSAAGGVVKFGGGNLDAKTPDTFTITFTAPTTPGVINFPIVQHCVVGETDWIQIQEAGQPEPANPAAQVTVTAGPPTSADLVVAPDDDDDAATDTTVAAASTATSGVATGSAPVPTVAPAKKTTDDSNAGVIVAVVAAVVVLGGLGAYVATRKKRPTT